MRFRTVEIVWLSTTEQTGFTLLEVLVAVLILSMAYVAVLQNFSISLKNIDKIGKTRQVVFEELLTFSKDTKFTGADQLEGDEKEEGTLFIEGVKYRVMAVKSDSGELETLKLQTIL
ncbi:MAG: type II secretion system GspH family protein [Proteobacteria bacterium]|nr:type II secretion system GspH family protein [Pseudomonadota bacterium]MBU4298007.1 type II secretion system GspH family protein [Pseudomonadota bacterium]MCG2749567.1 type II secretion system GspH family protein [Desulfobulbaceae bacterium]